MLHYDVQGDGDGSTRVVLVHGFTQDRRSWRPVAEPLAATRQVISVDAPGHGRSAAVRADMGRAALMLGDAGGVADYVGYSMGGRLALRLAADRPDLVRRLVLVGATAGIDDEAERAARREADDALATDLETRGLDPFLDRWLANPLFATLPAEAAAVDQRRENSVEGLAASLRLMGTGAQEPLWDRLPRMQMPVLFVVGALDTKFTALAERMAAAWGGPAEVAVIPGAGHAVHLEQPHAFLATVLPFLAADHPTATPTASSNP